MTTPVTPVSSAAGDDASGLISTGAQALIDSANKLGLTWQLKLATIGSNPTPTQPTPAVLGILDGDTDPISLTSILGYPPPMGARVYVLVIPPAGNFIIGNAAATGAPFFRRYYVNGLTSQNVSIPSNLRHIRVYWKCCMTSGGAVSMQCRVNGDATANQHIILGITQTNAALAAFQSAALDWLIGILPQVASGFGQGILDIWDWDKPSVGYLPFQAQSACPAAGVNNYYDALGGHYIPVGPYSSLLFFPSGGVIWGPNSEIQIEGYY